MDEIIVFLMREFGWSYDDTIKLVGKLPIKKLNALIAEAQYQRAVEDYKLASYAAMIVACLASDKHRRKKIKDIIGDPPQRSGKPTKRTVEAAAIDLGIELPEEGK